MASDSIFRGLGYLIVAAGLALALITATVPQHAMGHHLMLELFLLAATPYVIYGAFVPFMRGGLLLVPGLILLGLQLSRQVPAWLALESPTIPDAFFDSTLTGVIITVPLLVILTWWSQRGGGGTQSA